MSGGHGIVLDDGTEVVQSRRFTLGSNLSISYDAEGMPQIDAGAGAASHVIATTAGLGTAHTTSGLTAGQVLRATAATTAAFQSLVAGDIPDLSGTYATTGHGHGQLHDRSHALSSGSDHTGFLPATMGGLGADLSGVMSLIHGNPAGTGWVELVHPAATRLLQASGTGGSRTIGWVDASIGTIGGSVSNPAIPYATGADTLGDTHMTRISATEIRVTAQVPGLATWFSLWLTGETNNPQLQFRLDEANDLAAIDFNANLLSFRRGGGERMSLSNSLFSVGVTSALQTISSGTWQGTAITSTYIGSLPASKITSGQLATARGGTNLDLSAMAQGTVLACNSVGVLSVVTPSIDGDILTWAQGIDQIVWAQPAAGGFSGTTSNPYIPYSSGANTLSNSQMRRASATEIRIGIDTVGTENVFGAEVTGQTNNPLWQLKLSESADEMQYDITGLNHRFLVGGTGKVLISSTAMTLLSSVNLAIGGNVTSGTWQGTAIASTYVGNLPASKITSGQLAMARGGTNLDLSSMAKGSVLVCNSTGVLSVAAGTVDGYVLTYQSGTDTIDWLIASSHTHLQAQISDLPIIVASGGTGRATLTTGRILVGAGTSAVTYLTPSPTGILRANTAASAWEVETGSTNQYLKLVTAATNDVATWSTLNMGDAGAGTLAINRGGTNATSFANSDYIVIYDGTRLVTWVDKDTIPSTSAANTWTVKQTFQVASNQIELRTAASGVAYITFDWNPGTEQLVFGFWDSGGGPRGDCTFDSNGTVINLIIGTVNSASVTTSTILSSVQKTDLTDSGASTLHYHAADRLRSNHSGTQAPSTISAGTFAGLFKFSSLLEIEHAGDEILRLEDTSSTGNPYVSFYQNGTRRSFIQHLDSGDTFCIMSEYGPISLRPGISGTEEERFAVDNTASSPERGFAKATNAALFSEMYSHGTPSGNFTCYGRAGNKHHAILSANRQITIDLEEDGQELTLYVQADSGAARTITWAGALTFNWADDHSTADVVPQLKTNVFYFERISGELVVYVISEDTLGVL